MVVVEVLAIGWLLDEVEVEVEFDEEDEDEVELVCGVVVVDVVVG